MMALTLQKPLNFDIGPPPPVGKGSQWLLWGTPHAVEATAVPWRKIGGVMVNRKKIASILAASVAGAVMFATPAAALPGGNSGDPAQSIPDLFVCYPQDATGAADLNGTCTSKNTLKLDSDGDPAVGMYWDHGQISEGAPHPTSTVTFDNSFAFGEFWITCTSRLAPSGMYNSTCYFNKQTQNNFQP